MSLDTDLQLQKWVIEPMIVASQKVKKKKKKENLQERINVSQPPLNIDECPRKVQPPQSSTSWRKLQKEPQNRKKKSQSVDGDTEFY